MKVFSGKAGTPTIIIALTILALSAVFFTGSANRYRQIGIGKLYSELATSGLSNEEASKIALQKEREITAYYAIGLHVPLTLLLLIAVGLISKSTTQEFKGRIRFIYLVIAAAGIYLYSKGLELWGHGEGSIFPNSLLPSFVIYFAISALIWAAIGIGLFVRRKQKANS